MDDEIFSPGLEGITAGETAISTLTNGLSYRGYAIEDLSEHSSFDEVAYLILYGNLPTATEFSAFQQRLVQAAILPPEFLNVLARIPHTAPMMDVMRSAVSLLAHWDDDVRSNSPEANLRKSERLLAQLPVAMTAAFRLRAGLEPVPPQAARPLAENILWMLRGKEPDQQSVKALDLTLIMYAEHEYNASTFSARVITSTMSDLHSAITGAIGALKGPLHGGANERVLELLQEIGSAERAVPWLRDAFAKKVRIMGFGHRVYKSGDIRAKHLKPICGALATTAEFQKIEQIAAAVEQFVEQEKGLLPNLDWPSARIYHYLGLPVELYTPLFVLSRITGWCAHVSEQTANNRLIRPRSRYVGPESRRWIPVPAR